MTQIPDIADWLNQVWDEEEADAQRAIDLTVDSYPADQFNVWWRWARAYEVRSSGAGGFTTAAGAPSPTQVLARIAADRKILEQRDQVRRDLAEHNADPRRQMNVPILVNIVLALDTTVKHLASAYKDRHGYQESWAVQ